MTFRRSALYILVLGLVGLLSEPVLGQPAQTLFGITGPGGNQLITINTATGAGTLVGPFSTAIASPGLGFRGNQLFAWDANAQRLREINPATAGFIGVPIDIGVTGGAGGDMSFCADGTGFLTLNPPSVLHSFDLTIPNSALITGSLIPQFAGLAFNSAGVLYGLKADELYTINTTTGATTLVGPTGLSPGLQGLGLASDATGQLWASVSSVLYQGNSVTGTLTPVGPIGFSNVTGLSFAPVPAPPPPPPPPTPPSPAPGGSEGSFPGSRGPRGSEGGFGFGQGIRVRGGDFHRLLGPFPDIPESMHMTVYNVSHQQLPPVMSARGAHRNPPKCFWVGLVVVLLATSLIARTAFKRRQCRTLLIDLLESANTIRDVSVEYRITAR